MIKSIYFIAFLLGSIYGQTFQIARIQYSGGGDWYCDPSSLPNLLSYLNNNKFNMETVVKYIIPTLLSKYGR